MQGGGRAFINMRGSLHEDYRILVGGVVGVPEPQWQGGVVVEQEEEGGIAAGGVVG